MTEELQGPTLGVRLKEVSALKRVKKKWLKNSKDQL